MQPTPEVVESLARFTRDSEYCNRHYHELLERYPEKWVAIHNEEVVETNEDFDQLLAALRRRGLDPGRVLTRFLTHEEEYWELEDFS